jgi:hypothetical protein
VKYPGSTDTASFHGSYGLPPDKMAVANVNDVDVSTCGGIRDKVDAHAPQKSSHASQFNFKKRKGKTQANVL